MIASTRRLYSPFADLNVTTVYYCRDSTVTTPTFEEDKDDKCRILFLPGEETYMPGILQKTMQVLRVFFPENEESDFDFVVRSNSSTVINFKVLLPLLEQRKDQLYYCGPLIVDSQEVNSKIDPTLSPLPFVTGTCIILKRNAVKALLKFESLLNFEILDDPAIALLFKQLKHPPPVQLGCQFAYFRKQQNVDQIVSFRHHRFHSDRVQDTTDVESAVQAIMERAALSQSNPRVAKIMYHTADITDKVLLLCKFAGGRFATDGNNTILDDFFGDPAPGMAKNIIIVLESGQVYSQKATLYFSLFDRTKMCVC